MPTIIRIGGFRFFFYSNENSEPPHIHVEKGDDVAKFWLDPVELAYSYGFSAKEINQLSKLVVQYQAILLKAWNDYFS